MQIDVTFVLLNILFEKTRLLYRQEILNHFFLFAYSVFSNSDSD